MQAISQTGLQQRSRQLAQSFPPAVKAFFQFHGIQLLGSDLPLGLIEPLFNKLQGKVYDGGEYFTVLDNQDRDCFEVYALKDLPKHSNIFLIDHALTFRYSQLRKTLQKHPTVHQRLSTMLKYQHQAKQLQLSSETAVAQQQDPNQLQFDNMQLCELTHLQFPNNLITLSLINNRLESEEEIIKKLEYLNLKALWLNDNPVAESAKLLEYIQRKTKIQLYNSKFTTNCGEWGLNYVRNRDLAYASNTLSHQVHVLALDNRNVYNVPLETLEKFSQLRVLSIKGHDFATQGQQQYLLAMLRRLPTLRYLTVDQSVEQFLYTEHKTGNLSTQISQQLMVNNHSLLMPAPTSLETTIDTLQGDLLKIAGCYRLANTQQLDQSACWYVNDELGSMIPHSDAGNAKLIPFLYAPGNIMNEEVVAYTLLWTTQDVRQGELVTRDYLYGMKENKQRSARLAIWYKLPSSYYVGGVRKYDQRMQELEKASVQILQRFYASNASKQKQLAERMLTKDYVEVKHKVLTDYEYIKQYLNNPQFQFTESLEEATVVWLNGAADESAWTKYTGRFLFNQFPYESCVVMKDNLADTVQSTFGDTRFLMRTYNLEKELNLLIGDYYRRQEEGLDNLWILKPPNMARSMDMVITDNLSVIIKMMETGPKIVQKYISSPVLLRGRKVDLRYILLVKSISPLTLFLYKHFWIRSSNNPYTIDRRYLTSYETQFTVMNYGQVSQFKQIPYGQFIQEFEQGYGKWSVIHDKIRKMLRNVFIAVCNKYPQMHDENSRAVYGVDVMIEAGTLEPKLLEITFAPDCKRACEYYPGFYNEVFETLFTDGTTENMERII